MAREVTENWLPIVGWEGFYEVSDQGRVRSIDRIIQFRSGQRRYYAGQIIKPWRSMPGNYPMVKLKGNGRKINRRIHVLVLEAFVGPRPEGMEGCHNNSIPSDNRQSNLRWDTDPANKQDALRAGTNWQAGKTHCTRGGHEFTPENTYTRPGTTTRQCRTCVRERYLRTYIPKRGKRQTRRTKCTGPRSDSTSRPLPEPSVHTPNVALDR